VIHRADGGGHDASNIVLVCSACHLAHHRGALTISGTATELQIRRPGEAAVTSAQDDAVGVAGSPAHGTHVGVEPRPQGSMAAVDGNVAACGVSPVAALDAHVGAMSSAGLVEGTSVRVSGACRLDAEILRTQAKTALTGLGWKPAIAHAAVAAAADAQRDQATLERLIFEALRRCPTPRR
jgi:hypothetical protein